MIMITRVHPAGVVPLELWDVVVDGVPLYRHPPAAQGRATAQAVLALREGSACRRLGQRLPAAAFSQVHVGGGGDVDAVVAALLAVGVHAVAVDDPVAIAVVGGFALARDAGVLDPIVVDVGQTSLKWFSLSARGRQMRPHLPDRAAAVRWLASALTSAISASVEVQKQWSCRSVVLALPAEVSDDLAVADCSYPWADGDRLLVHDVIGAAGLAVPTVVLNDAELAAVSVQQQRPPCPALVLTVGTGVGAALVVG
jgi:predicted NBD/HSP70 family sugar kinase